jgi:APA family basic amino acid/polyamine antiporter
MHRPEHRPSPCETSRGGIRAPQKNIHAAGAEIVSVLVVLSTLGALNGVILAGPRVYYAMAQDDLLPRRFGAVHQKFRTPHLAITLQAIWASFLIATNTYRGLFTRVVYTEWLFFASLAAALYFLRRRADYQPAFRLAGYKVWCFLFIAASLFIVVTQIVHEPASSITGLLFVLSGFPVYYLVSFDKRKA